MPKTSLRPRDKISAGTDGASSHGQEIQNFILLDLPAEQRRAVLEKCELVQIPAQFVLNEMTEPIEYGYFVNGGLVSILTVMSNGKSVEVGLTGKEGFVGLPLVVGFKTSPNRAIAQVAGTAFRVAPADLEDLLLSSPGLEKRLQRYAQELALQGQQLAACNRLHEVEERLARWLLMSQDRVGSSSFELTQESLANMLGTRRASVTIAAGILQKAGLITYKRGEVNIEKRAELEEAACECYALLNQQLERWEKDHR
jgi:CRP-like cAMP-binding protein